MKQKVKTRWKRRKQTPFKGERLFGEDFGFFQIKKAWDCKEFCRCATALDGTHWFPKTKVEILTETGLKYQVPFLWLIFNSTKNGKLLWKIIDGIE